MQRRWAPGLWAERRNRAAGLILPVLAAAVVGCRPTGPAAGARAPVADEHPIVAAARAQVGVTLRYDPGYERLDYPGGDVPLDRGVCTDVVIRALRTAWAMDLQELVHRDMKGAFSDYPRDWGLRRPDPNIDHRRVPNLRRYFERQGWELDVTRDPTRFLPGDLVTCTVPPNRPHIMVVSSRRTPAGVPLVIHNIGGGVQKEDRLFEFPLTGHYRLEAGGSSLEVGSGRPRADRRY